MADLIDRQQAIDTVSEACWELRGVFGRCEENLLALPSAQPQCRTGRWIRKTDTRFGEMLNDILICSECGIAFSTRNMIRRSYCPNCGARMDGESDG